MILARSTGSGQAGGIGGIPEALAVEPNVFIYDNYPGGIGFSRPLFEMHDLLLERTRELIDGCECHSGCPSCVGPEGNTGPRARQGASRMLAALRPVRLAHGERGENAAVGSAHAEDVPF